MSWILFIVACAKAKTSAPNFSDYFIVKINKNYAQVTRHTDVNYSGHIFLEKIKDIQYL